MKNQIFLKKIFPTAENIPLRPLDLNEWPPVPERFNLYRGELFPIIVAIDCAISSISSKNIEKLLTFPRKVSC